MEFVFEYGLFLAKTVTLVVAILLIVAVVFALGSKGRRPERGHIEVLSLNEGLNHVTRTLKQVVLNDSEWKAEAKAEKKKHKEQKKTEKSKDSVERKPRVFVIDFDGDV